MKPQSATIHNNLHYRFFCKHVVAAWLLCLGCFSAPTQAYDSAVLASHFSGCPDAVTGNCSGAGSINTDLSGADMSSANLSMAWFYNVNLSGADLSYANLTNGSVSSTNLSGANLSNTNLSGIRSSFLTGTPASLPTNWSLRGGYLVGPSANLSNDVLDGLDLSGINLTNANLDGAFFNNTNLANTNLTNTNMYSQFLAGVSSGGIIGTPATLPPAWLLRNGYLIGPGANLGNADLSGVNLQYVNLTDTNLSGANLTNVTLKNTNLTNANLSNTTLNGVRSGSIAGTPVSIPVGWRFSAGYLIGPGANLSNESFVAVFHDINLIGADLSGANLTYSNLTGVNLAGINLSNANLTAAVFSSDLSNANLTNANLTNAYLSSHLTNANMAGTILSGIRSSQITGTPATLPPDWKIINKHLVGPGANLSNTDFSYIDLSGNNLTGINFSGANLSSANLTGTNLTNANLTYTDLSGVIWSNTICTDAVNSNLHINGSCLEGLDIDTDGDGFGNSIDMDDDNDGVADYIDADPLDPAIHTEKILPLDGIYQGSSTTETTDLQ